MDYDKQKALEMLSKAYPNALNWSVSCEVKSINGEEKLKSIYFAHVAISDKTTLNGTSYMTHTNAAKQLLASHGAGE